MTVVDIGLVMCHDEDRTAGLQPFGGAAVIRRWCSSGTCRYDRRTRSTGVVGW